MERFEIKIIDRERIWPVFIKVCGLLFLIPAVSVFELWLNIGQPYLFASDAFLGLCFFCTILVLNQSIKTSCLINVYEDSLEQVFYSGPGEIDNIIKLSFDEIKLLKKGYRVRSGGQYLEIKWLVDGLPREIMIEIPDYIFPSKNSERIRLCCSTLEKAILKFSLCYPEKLPLKKMNADYPLIYNYSIWDNDYVKNR